MAIELVFSGQGTTREKVQSLVASRTECDLKVVELMTGELFSNSFVFNRPPLFIEDSSGSLIINKGHLATFDYFNSSALNLFALLKHKEDKVQQTETKGSVYYEALVMKAVKVKKSVSVDELLQIGKTENQLKMINSAIESLSEKELVCMHNNIVTYM